MYALVLSLHSLVRWLVLGAGLASLVTAYRGLRGGVPWTDESWRFARLFCIFVDVQCLLGAALYLVFSPITNVGMKVAAVSSRGSDLEFFGTYHGLIMIVALVDVHVSTVIIRRAQADSARYRRALFLYAQTFLLIGVGIPWWRPLLRTFF